MASTEGAIIEYTGPIGAGKTPVLSQLLSGNRPRFTFVNADIIAAALNSADQDAEYFRTGRLSPRRIFSSRVEAEICECGGVIGADTLYGTVYK